METKSGEENHNTNPYKLLDLIPTANNNKEWALYKNAISTSNKPHQRENNLELRLGLGLPGGQEETTIQEDQKKKWLVNIDKNKTPVIERDGDFNHAVNYHHHSHSLVTHCYSDSCPNNKTNHGQDHSPQRHQVRSFPAVVPWGGLTAGHLKDGSSQQQLLCNSSMILGSSEELADMKNRAGGFHPPPKPPPSRTGPSPQAPANNNTSTTSVLPPSNSSQKRAAPGPVVGWPPIRSFRKNLASSSNTNNNNNTKQQPDSNQNGYHPSSSSRPAAIEKMKKPADQTYKGQFVKINMDGVAIGRKVDLSKFDNYEKLSSSVDNLFRGLLAAQSGVGIHEKDGEDEQRGKPITGLLDGNGEYTLVYEDNEGDRMLVGDVPWHMFLSTVKRLRVLKTSEWLKMSKGNDSKEGKKVAPESLNAAR